MSDIPEFKPYNPAEPFIKMKLEGSILDRLADAGIPAMRALKYFHENPEGKATTFFSLLADDFIPFKYQIQSGEATPSSLAKEAILMAMPTREGKAAERSRYQSRNLIRDPIELSNRPIVPDDNLRAATEALDELVGYDDRYNHGPGILVEDDRPYDLTGSEYVNLDEAREFDNYDGTLYNSLLEELANEEDLARIDNPDGNYYDYRQHKLDPEDVAKYDEAAETFRNAINQADYNDIIIGDGTPLATKSAQDLARNIEYGAIEPTRYQWRSIFNGQSMESFLKDYVEHNNYSMTQQDLKNIISAFTPREILSRDPAIANLYEQMKSEIANNPGNEVEIRRTFVNKLDDLISREGLE